MVIGGGGGGEYVCLHVQVLAGMGRHDTCRLGYRQTLMTLSNINSLHTGEQGQDARSVSVCCEISVYLK